MWQIDPAPFEMHECTTSTIRPLSYWGDYNYTIASDNDDDLTMTQIDPDALELASLRPMREKNLFRLGGKAIRTIWQHRKEIPMYLWEPNVERLPVTGVRTSSFALD